MSRKGSVATLLVVAVVALGLMAFIGFNDGTTGAVQVGGGAPSISYPTQTDSYYYTQQGGPTASDYNALKEMLQDKLEFELTMYCPKLKPDGTKETERLMAICQKYRVPTNVA